MQIETTSIIIIIGLSLSAALIVYFLLLRRKKSMYDVENQKAILDDVRSDFERQIYALNDRLIQNEERWRDVNHLLLRKEYLENKSPIARSKKFPLSDFLRANGVSENDLIIDNHLIFILTPFHDNYFEDFKVIKDICTGSGFNCLRGDESDFKGDIFPQILKYIAKANLIIANINGRNPNVMYELGIAQALDKTVILISRKPEELPFDVKSKRFLIYSSYSELKDMLRDELLDLASK